MVFGALPGVASLAPLFREREFAGEAVGRGRRGGPFASL
jgi:hypothetical protein